MKHLYDNLYVAGQITERDFPALAEAGVRVIINNRPDNEEPGQISAADAEQLASEYGIAYHHLPMANGQPLPPELVVDFRNIVSNEKGAILAHCRSGMRSSFLWAMGAIEAGAISVDAAIDAAKAAGIPLNNARSVLQNVAS